MLAISRFQLQNVDFNNIILALETKENSFHRKRYQRLLDDDCGIPMIRIHTAPDEYWLAELANHNDIYLNGSELSSRVDAMSGRYVENWGLIESSVP